MGDILTNAEAAALLRVSQSYLNKTRLTGSGPAFCKFGAKVVYRRQALEEWLRERECLSTAEAEALAPSR